jgi:hypothetical protein
MLPADAFAQTVHALLVAPRHEQAAAWIDFRREVRSEVSGMRDAGILPEAVIVCLKRRTADAMRSRSVSRHLVVVTRDLVGDVAQWCIAEYFRPPA